MRIKCHVLFEWPLMAKWTYVIWIEQVVGNINYHYFINLRSVSFCYLVLVQCNQKSQIWYVCQLNLSVFFLDFGLSRLTSLQFILYHVAGYYKPTIPKSPPSHFQDNSTCNNARLEFSTIFVPSFDPNEWCLKSGLHSGGLNPGPLGHEPSALTTRPQLLARGLKIFNKCTP